MTVYDNWREMKRLHKEYGGSDDRKFAKFLVKRGLFEDESIAMEAIGNFNHSISVGGCTYDSPCKQCEEPKPALKARVAGGKRKKR